MRALVAADAEAVVDIQRACPEAAQWAASDYARVGELFVGWVAVVDDDLAGFVVARPVGEEWEILNLAVHPARRRAGIGRRLLDEALEAARRAHAKRAFLEVRESNDGAAAFYARQGFASAGRRRQYYTAPVEDALVLALPLA